MGEYRNYHFIELRQMQNSKKPENNHLWIENATYGIYFVDSSSNTVLLKTTDEGTTVSTVFTGSYPIIAIYHDRANNDLYLLESRKATDGFAATDGVIFTKIEMDNSDNDTTLRTLTNDANDQYLGIDVFYNTTNTEVEFIVQYKDTTGAPDYFLIAYNAGGQVDSSPTSGLSNWGFITEVSAGLFYWLADDGTNIYLCWWDSVDWDAIRSLDDHTVPDSRAQIGLAYDGDDTLYHISKKTADGKNYLCRYSIVGASSTSTNNEYNVSLMLDRNCISTIGSPWEYEKGIHLASSYVYKINKGINYLLKLQDLGLTGGETIIAISDNYLITSNSDLYEYTDCMDKLLSSGHEENLYSVPTGSLINSSELSADQLIEIYFYSTIRADYTLVFKGKAGIGELDDRKRWNYNLVNLGAKDFAQSVSYTASATGIDEVVIALVGQLTNPYIWCDTDSVPNIATNMTYVFDNSTLWDALYVCAVLANAYFWVTADGCLYFRTYASMEQTGWYLGSGGLNYETVGTSSTSIDWVDSATLPNACTCTIEASLNNHYNILKLTHDAGGSAPNITHTISAVSGTFEWWWATSDITRLQRVDFIQSSQSKIHLKIENSKYYYRAAGDVDTEIVGDTPVNNIFDHFKVVFDCATDTFDLYINGVLLVNDGTFNNNATTIDTIRIFNSTDAAYSQYIDAPGLVGETDPRGVVYVAGYNDEDTLNQATNNISYPTSERMESKFNIWDIDGGWNEAANAPFNKRETDEEHILQYGPNQWTGRDTFSGARTQAALDAIAAGLKAWQGMMDAPYNASFRLIGRWYYPIGKYMNFQFTPEATFTTAADMLISRCSYDHKNPKMVWMTLTQNIVRMG